MSQTTDERVRQTTGDLELLPESRNRYEIIDGELFLIRAPHNDATLYGYFEEWGIGKL